jgi:hypothetical protein
MTPLTPLTQLIARLTQSSFFPPVMTQFSPG